MQVSRALHGKYRSALASLEAQAIQPAAVFIGLSALEEQKVSMDVLLNDLLHGVGYPFDTIVRGLFKANMLELRIAADGSGRVSLCMVKEWGAPLRSVGLDITDGASAVAHGVLLFAYRAI